MIKNEAPLLMTDEEFIEVKKALNKIGTLKAIAVKDRTVSDIKTLTDACKLVSSKQEEFFQKATKRGLEIIKVGNFQTADTIQQWLNEAEKIKVPKLDSLSQDTISKALQEMYSATASVQGALEELEPLCNKLDKIYAECVNIGKLVSLAISEWGGEIYAGFLVPQDIKEVLLDLRYAVDTYRRKERALDKTYEILSRLITVNQMYVPESKPTEKQQFTKPSWKK